MPILLLLQTNWKPIAIVLAILTVFYAGYHVCGAFDQIEANKLLAAQAEANKQAQEALDAKSAKVEADLAAERVKSSDLQKRWSKLNAAKHTVCVLPAAHVQLLKDATANPNTNSK